MGRRVLRYALIGLGLLLLGGLWAFSFFLFNPFEGGYEFPLASLIPRDVDFYAAKNGLENDFDPFPRPAFLERFEASPQGQALEELGLRDLVASWKVEESLAELERGLAQSPVQVDPLSLFGGAGLAVAGTFKGARIEEADWAVYGRTSWLGKLAVELVSAGWVDLSAQGITVTPFESQGEKLGVSLSGGELPRPLFLARLLDVVIVTTNGALVQAAHDFEAARGRDSFGQSATYTDNIARPGRSGEELELYLDQRALTENTKRSQAWPDPRSNDLVTAVLGRLFQLDAVREVMGTADFASVVTLEATGELTSNVLTPFQQHLYEERGFDEAQVTEVASLVPADAALFVYLHADIGDLLRELRAVVMASDPKAIENLEGVVRSAWNYTDLDPLIDDLDKAFRDRVAFFVRDYDFPEEVSENIPPHNEVPVPAWGLILWPQDPAKILELRSVIHRRDMIDMLGIRGREPGSNGLWKNTLEGGAEVHEYWNALVPGTGHIATLEMKGRDAYFVFTNVSRLLGRMFKTYHAGAAGGAAYQRLSENPSFQAWTKNGLPSANALVWAAPGALTPTARRMADWNASENAGDYIDWNVERPRIERKVLAEDFPGETWGNVSPDKKDAYDLRVDQEIERFQARYLEENLPRMRAEAERRLTALQALSAGFLELASDRKRLRLHGRFSPSFLTEP